MSGNAISVTRLDLFIKQAGVKPSGLAERAGVNRHTCFACGSARWSRHDG
jgi:hypothetical protein